MKNKSIAELAQTLPDSTYLYTEGRGAKIVVLTSDELEAVAEFEVQEEADKYIRRFNRLKVALFTRQTLRSFLSGKLP